MRIVNIVIFILLIFNQVSFAANKDEIEGAELGGNAIFDDRALINGYTDKYADESKETLLAMIADESLGDYKTTAAIRVFKQRYAPDVFAAEKPTIIKLLFRRFNHSDSAFVQVEIMHTLVVLDHYQYFDSMVPALILKIDHYNRVVSALAYDNLQEILKTSNRTREARIVFKTLRKIFFLSRKRIGKVSDPDMALRHKLELVKWSIKLLGTQELKNLPQEVINLL